MYAHLSAASTASRAFPVPDTAAIGASDASAASAPLATRCSAPICLAGERLTVDRETGEIVERFASADAPDGVVLVACGNRRASRCPSCSTTYRRDAYALVRAGLVGDEVRGVSAELAGHPRVFATLTAPSFGAVHRRLVRGPSTLHCRARATDATCFHGRPLSCHIRHGQDDSSLGQPLCPDYYDYEGAVLWNAHAGALWRRTTIAMSRLLAARAGVSRTEVTRLVRLSFVKVAEFQTRGLVHLHVILRLDGPDPERSAPPSWATTELLAEIVAAAAAQTSLRTHRPDGTPLVVRWGSQLDIRSIRPNAEGECSDVRVAGYLAKYATKAAENAGGADRRLRSAYEIGQLPVTDHARAMMATCWALGADPRYEHLRLRAWAHMLGFRGHFLTKARRYSVTFGTLRTARLRYRTKLALFARALAGEPVFDPASTLVIRGFAFAGVGMPNLMEARWSAEGSAP
ncbi:MAG TPA: replication initiator [Terriglobales bacterium]|nr:replication initiator [Terriglobales bacterium]